MKMLRTKGFFEDGSAVSAVEFALVLPIMLSIMFGGYVVTEAVSIHRKVTITTRALADLTTEYPSISSDQMTAIINASKQIMAPYDPSPLKITISEIQLPGKSTVACINVLPTVTWSVGDNKYKQCNTYSLPAGMVAAGQSYIVSEVSYSYTPPVGYKVTGPITISDHIIMLPRKTQDIPYTGP